MKENWHVVMYSSGISSWAAAKLVALKYGTERLILLFGDTSIEDEDNYRFLEESAVNVGGELVRLKDGRTPWDVFFEQRFISNRVSHCSHQLKIKPCKKWIKDNAKLERSNTCVYFGIDGFESHRMPKIRENWQSLSHFVDFPLTWGNWMTKQDSINWARSEGLEPPRMYEMGFAHANCGGFCPKAGMKHYSRLLEVMPDRYKHHERKEQDFREFVGKDIAMLRSRANKTVRPLTLKEYRLQLEGNKQLGLFEAEGGCGCFTEEQG